MLGNVRCKIVERLFHSVFKDPTRNFLVLQVMLSYVVSIIVRLQFLEPLEKLIVFFCNFQKFFLALNSVERANVVVYHENFLALD